MLYVYEKGLFANLFLYITHRHDNDNVKGHAIETLRRDRSVSNFHPVTLTCWRVLFKLCKLFVLQHHCDFNKHIF